MMNLGFVSAILPELAFEEVAAFASRERFRCVELMCWPAGKAERRYAGVTHIDAAELSDERARHIRGEMEKRRIRISALGYYPNPLDEDSARRRVYTSHIRAVIDAAARLGVPLVNTFAGRMQSRPLRDNMAEFAAVWQPLADYAEERGVRIGIENCPMYFTADEWPAGHNLAVSPAVWAEMFRLVPCAGFGLNYDPSHLLWQRMDYIKPLYEFRDRIFHVHAKDVKMYQDRLDRVGILAPPLDYHSPKLPGLGDVNWGAFFSALTDIGYRGDVCIEVEDRAYEHSLEGRKAALRQSRDYLSVYAGAHREEAEAWGLRCNR